jgi:hypothetical protein
MPKRARNRPSFPTQKRRQPLRGIEPWPDAREALAALARAWIVAMIATTLLVAALALAPIWDSAVFMQALRDSSSTNPETAPLPDEAPAVSRRVPELLGPPGTPGRGRSGLARL